MNTDLNATKQDLIIQLFEIEQKLFRKASEIGFRFALAPGRVQRFLEGLENSLLSAAHKNLTDLYNVLTLAQESGVDPWSDREFLALSMRYAKLSFPKEFYDCMSPSLIVEGYDMFRRQTFRNLVFMEVSSYSLLEVTTHEWPMLFHRDQAITEMIIKQAEVNMWKENKVIQSEIPRHYIRELLSEKPQVFEVQQKQFAPLFAGPDQPGGILVISYGKLLGTDQHVDRQALSFI